MDVGVITTHIPPAKGYGGVSVTAGVLTKAWSEKGYKITLISSDESIDGRLKVEDVALGDTVTVKLYRCYGFRRWGFGLSAIPLIFKLCLDAPVIYIHGIATWPSTLAAIFCTVLRRPFMVAVHGGLMPEHVELIKREKPHKWWYYRLITFPTLRRACSIHCTSQTEAQGVRDVIGDSTRVFKVPNGIAYQHIEVAQQPKMAGQQICFLGHIQQEKGINTFIKAWLKVRRPEDRLVIAGRSVDGDYFKRFQALVAESQGAITYRGYLEQSEVQALLAASHFLVLPSGLEVEGGMRENFGNVVAEAMAAGRPVLVAKGLAWDHLESVGAGFVFERHVGALGDVLYKTQAMSDADWLRMSMNARNYVEQELSATQLGDKVWSEMMAPLTMNPASPKKTLLL